jgi:WD40 repeat protein
VKSAEQASQEKLWESYLDEARAYRWSGRAGRRFHNLEIMAKAAAIRPSLELRNEAIASMALADIRFMKVWTNQFTRQRMQIDHSFKRYAVSDPVGGIAICSVNNDQLLIELKSLGQDVQRIFSFSHDGQFLAARYQDSLIRVWDLSHRQIVLCVPGNTIPKAWANLVPALDLDSQTVDFSPDDRQLAVATGANGAVVYSFDSTQKTNTYASSRNVVSVRFSPNGKKLAAFYKSD